MIRICAWAASLAMVAVVVGAAVGFGFTFVPAAAASLANVPADPPPPLPDRTGVWPVNFTFYGNASTGWGFSNATIANPGPNITVYYGDTVNLTLVGNDPLAHSWFVDYDNSFAPNGNEPSSPPFNGPGNPAILVWAFSALQPGNWTYRCGVHPFSMRGSVSIVGGPPAELPKGALPLITGIMVGALSVVLVFAVIYHVRAVRAAKRMR